MDFACMEGKKSDRKISSTKTAIVQKMNDHDAVRKTSPEKAIPSPKIF